MLHLKFRVVIGHSFVLYFCCFVERCYQQPIQPKKPVVDLKCLRRTEELLLCLLVRCRHCVHNGCHTEVHIIMSNSTFPGCEMLLVVPERKQMPERCLTKENNSTGAENPVRHYHRYHIYILYLIFDIFIHIPIIIFDRRCHNIHYRAFGRVRQAFWHIALGATYCRHDNVMEVRTKWSQHCTNRS